jgi:hypothetical protein
MSIELLDAEFVTECIAAHGWTRKWVLLQLGLGKEGYKFLRGEWLPKDPARKARLVGQLAKMLGKEVPQILLRLEAKTRRTA